MLALPQLILDQTKKQNIARIVLTMEIRKLEELGRIMDKTGQLPNIIDVHRQLAGGYK